MSRRAKPACYNYRLSNIQAAMGVAQMEQIGDFLARKRTIARSYDEGFRTVDGIIAMPSQTGTDPAYWLYTVLLQDGITLEGRKAVIDYLNRQGIGARPLFHPLHSLPPYAKCQAFQVETADSLYRRAVSLPSSPGLSARDQQRCIVSLIEVLANRKLGSLSG